VIITCPTAVVLVIVVWYWPFPIGVTTLTWLPPFDVKTMFSLESGCFALSSTVAVAVVVDWPSARMGFELNWTLTVLGGPVWVNVAVPDVPAVLLSVAVIVTWPMVLAPVVEIVAA
jgi:hypothetical protein